MSIPETKSAGVSIPGVRQRVADGLWRAAMVVLAAMPVGMAVAHRSSPLFLVLSALFSLSAIVAEEKFRPFLRKVFAVLASPLGLAVLTFLGWGLISIGWSEFKLASLRAFGEFWLSIAAVLILSQTLVRRMTHGALWLLAGAFVTACGLIVFELATGLAFRRSLGAKAYGFIFNRSVLTLLVLTPPLVVWFLGHIRYGRALSLGLVVILSATVLQSESQAAMLGLIAAGLVLLIAWLSSCFAWGLMAGSLAVTLLIAPLIGPIGNSLLPASLHEAMAAGHSRERVDLWTSFGAAVREQPFLGSGFGVSPHMPETAVATKVPVDLRKMLSIGHPHNFALQIWTELGAVGITIVLGIITLVLRAVARQAQSITVTSLTLIAIAGTVASVGQGAWQGWWGASLGTAVIWMLVINRIQPEIRPQGSSM